MSGEKQLHKIFGDQLQKRMDNNILEVIEKEKHTGSKVHPRFSEADAFDDMRYETEQKILREQAAERRQKAQYVQPDVIKPSKKVITVKPND